MVTSVQGLINIESMSEIDFLAMSAILMIISDFYEGHEGVKWELGLALFWTGKMGFTHWDWDLATGNGMDNYKMGMGFLFFSGLCSYILKEKNKIS